VPGDAVREGGADARERLHVGRGRSIDVDGHSEREELMPREPGRGDGAPVPHGSDLNLVTRAGDARGIRGTDGAPRA